MSEVWETILEFDAASIPGTERQLVNRVADAAARLLPPTVIDRLKTAVSEAAMNAIEHGNHGQADLNVHVVVQASDRMVKTILTDHGGGQAIPTHTEPNLEAKLAGLETPRGWGLFLIRNMVDEMKVTSDDTHHAIELIFYRERYEHEQQSA